MDAEMETPAEVVDLGDAGTDVQSQGSIREQILAFITSKVTDAEPEVLLTTKAIGEALGTNPNNVTYHLAKLVSLGEVSTRSQGPRGTLFRLGGGPSTRRRGRRSAASVTSVAPAAPVEPTSSARPGRNFCPYCGGKILAADWRFCSSCGKPLQ